MFAPAAGAGCRIGPRHLFEAATEAVTECAPPAEWEDWHGAVASDSARGSGLCTSGVIMSQGFPVLSQRLDLVEPVMYLSWTDDVLVVGPPYTCAGNAPDHEAARSACCSCERGARTAEVDLA